MKIVVGAMSEESNQSSERNFNKRIYGIEMLETCGSLMDWRSTKDG